MITADPQFCRLNGVEDLSQKPIELHFPNNINTGWPGDVASCSHQVSQALSLNEPPFAKV